MKNVIPEVDSKSMDIVADNISKLKELFPEAFTEGKVDFDALKEVLGNYIDGREERYSFTWNGKSKARMLAQTPSAGTLRPCKEESVDWDTTKNLFIEGDNLEVLKLLQKSYHKKVKMIYIDPPYNTGKDFVYKDNFKDNIKNYKEITGQVDSEGRSLSSNPETSGRYHTDWLNMMYPRLKLARNLLKDDGVIFISINESELANLRKICDEIFGEENFFCEFVWQNRSGSMDSVDGVSVDHEYVLAYGKSKVRLKGVKRTYEKYSNPDNDPRGPWISDNLSAGKAGGDVYYPITDPETGNSFLPPKGRYWPYSPSTMQKKIEEGRVLFPNDKHGRPMLKRFQNEAKSEYLPVSSLLRNYTEKKLPNNAIVAAMNTKGTSELQELFGNKIFSFPKSTILVKSLIGQVVGEDGIVLDFFSGSGTTAHSVMQMNSESAMCNRFIAVQLPELVDEKSEAFAAGYKNIAEICKERIRRAAAKIKEENPDYQGDLGFRVFKLDSTNIKPWELDFDLTEQDLEDQISNIKHGRKDEDVLYEVLLKYGLDLTLPITEHSVAGQKVFDIGMGALMICLSDDITLDVVEGIAKLKDELKPEIMRVVFKDAGFADDVVKTNAVQILKQAGIEDVRSL
ncbi:site-specific DNA-methyltransferase [Providencia stuartii]